MGEPATVTCSQCKGATEDLGQLEIVTGGSSSSAKFWLGQLAEMKEQNWPVGVFRCTQCGHFELFDRSTT